MHDNKQNPAVETMQRPLDGVIVLDLTHAYSGPFCTMNLADQGATVIKIEPAGRGEQSRGWTPIYKDASCFFVYINRNKYGMSLDLKTPEGKEIFKKLVAKADVVCENFRVGTMERLGLGYEVLKEINPRLIYASISGYGLTGVRSERPCYDIVAQAQAGMMSVTGFPGQPTKVGPAIADSFAGSYLAMGVCMALYERCRTGKGKRLDVAMIDTIFSILGTSIVDYTIAGNVQDLSGNRDRGITPMDSIKAKDGEFVFSCGTERFWQRLCQYVMEMPELMEDPRFIKNGDRGNNVDALTQIIRAWAAQYTLDELEEKFVAAEIPFGKVQQVDKACELPEVQERNMLWSVQDVNMNQEIQIPGCPIKMHGSPDEIQRGAPAVGQHTEMLLKELLGADEAELAQWRDAGVI